jgi:hypothetical protein
MYAPSSYNDTVTGETLSSVSEKSETYSNEGSNNDYVVSLCFSFLKCNTYMKICFMELDAVMVSLFALQFYKEIKSMQILTNAFLHHYRCDIFATCRHICNS